MGWQNSAYANKHAFAYFDAVRTLKLLYSQMIWRAPWKNRISSTSVELRKSLVKPVTWQNISSCSVLSPEIVMHDAFNVTLWTSADICVAVHEWVKELNNSIYSATSLALRVILQCAPTGTVYRKIWVQLPGSAGLRLISRAGKEGSTVSSIICDRWLILG